MSACLESQRRIARLAGCFWLVAVLATILGGVFSRGVFTDRLVPGRPEPRPNRQQVATLQGKAAVDYLKEHGIYDQLRESIEESNSDSALAPQPGSSSPSATKQSPEVYVAKNPAQNLTAKFSASEVRLKSSQGDGREAAFKLRGCGYGKNIV